MAVVIIHMRTWSKLKLVKKYKNAAIASGMGLENMSK